MDTQDISTLSFEQAMDELEIVVRQLETGKIPLDEALSAYEKGVKLKKICEDKLSAAKSKIDLLIIENNQPVGGEPFHENIDG